MSEAVTSDRDGQRRAGWWSRTPIPARVGLIIGAIAVLLLAIAIGVRITDADEPQADGGIVTEPLTQVHQDRLDLYDYEAQNGHTPAWADEQACHFVALLRAAGRADSIAHGGFGQQSADDYPDASISDARTIRDTLSVDALQVAEPLASRLAGGTGSLREASGQIASTCQVEHMSEADLEEDLKVVINTQSMISEAATAAVGGATLTGPDGVWVVESHRVSWRLGYLVPASVRTWCLR